MRCWLKSSTGSERIPDKSTVIMLTPAATNYATVGFIILIINLILKPEIDYNALKQIR